MILPQGYLKLISSKWFCELLIDNLFTPLVSLDFTYVWWACFATDSQHYYGFQMCSSSRRILPLFVQGKLHTGASQEKTRPFNFTFHYIDDVLSLNNSKLGDSVDRIYPIELVIKNKIPETQPDLLHTLYLNLHLDSKCRLRTLQQKRWFQYSYCEHSF